MLEIPLLYSGSNAWRPILEHYGYRGEVRRVMFAAQVACTIRDALTHAPAIAGDVDFAAACMAGSHASLPGMAWLKPRKHESGWVRSGNVVRRLPVGGREAGKREVCGIATSP